MEETNLISPITYGERLVVFFDVMGWKAHVLEAGNDPVKIGQLSLIPRLLKSSSVLQAAATGKAQITSFSDCCVISMPYDQASLAQIFYGLCNVFVGAAVSGFLLRAGVTVGQLHHENDIVFGPALNEAHDLESKGVYPRIAVNGKIEELTQLPLLNGMTGIDDIGHFVNPYTLPFVRSEFLKKESFPQGTFMEIPTDKAVEIYTILVGRLEHALANAEGKAKDQVNWLYARVRQEHKKILGG
jgi:hypothetical protein